MDVRSEVNLVGVHPDLIRVVRRAWDLSSGGFLVTEGVRTLSRQRELLAAGASRTLKSRHIPSTNKSRLGEAVDLAALVGGQVRWDWPLYKILARHMKVAAGQLGVPLTWGGDWPRFRDGPHFELRRH